MRKQDVFVSPSYVHSIWLWHDLENFKKRLKALEAKVEKEGGIRTEAQVQALENKKLEDEACGEIEPRILVIWGLRTRSMRASERCWPSLPADLCGHLLQVSACQALDVISHEVVHSIQV